jgi:hypothetical protein
MDWKTLIASIMGGGVIGSFVAFKKAPAERDSIIVTAAQGVVLIQEKMLDEFKDQLRLSSTALAECHQEREDYRRRLSALEDEVANMRREPGARTRREDRRPR